MCVCVDNRESVDLATFRDILGRSPRIPRPRCVPLVGGAIIDRAVTRPLLPIPSRKLEEAHATPPPSRSSSTGFSRSLRERRIPLRRGIATGHGSRYFWMGLVRRRGRECRLIPREGGAQIPIPDFRRHNRQSPRIHDSVRPIGAKGGVPAGGGGEGEEDQAWRNIPPIKH